MSHEASYRWTILALAVSITGWTSTAESTAIIFSAAVANPGTSSPDPVVQDGGFGVSSAFATQTSVFGSSSFAGTASANATFGIVGASASAQLTNYEPGSYTMANPPFPPSSRSPSQGEAGFVDTLTITGGSGSAFLYLEFTAEGSSQNAQAIIDIWDGGPATGVVVSSTAVLDSASVDAVLPFTYGVPFTFSHTLLAGTSVFDLDFGTSLPYDYTGFADFSSTSMLTDFAVYSDATLQNRVLDFALVTDSGVDYRTFNQIPEPSAAWLLVLGLGLAARHLVRSGPPPKGGPGGSG